MTTAKKLVVETGLEPHFHVTDVRYETSSDGNLICYAYEEVRGELRLQFTSLITAPNLIRAAKAGMNAGSDAHNMSQWVDDDSTSH